MQLCPVYAAGHEQRRQALRLRPLDVGVRQSPDRQNPAGVDRCAPRARGRRQRPVINLGMRLSRLNNAPAHRLVGFRESPSAIDEPVAMLDHDVRVGADEFGVMTMQQPQPRLIICRGFALGLFEPDTNGIGGVFEVDEFELVTELRLRLAEYFPYPLAGRYRQAARRPLRENQETVTSPELTAPS